VRLIATKIPYETLRRAWRAEKSEGNEKDRGRSVFPPFPPSPLPASSSTNPASSLLLFATGVRHARRQGRVLVRPCGRTRRAIRFRAYSAISRYARNIYVQFKNSAAGKSLHSRARKDTDAARSTPAPGMTRKLGARFPPRSLLAAPFVCFQGAGLIKRMSNGRTS